MKKKVSTKPSSTSPLKFKIHPVGKIDRPRKWVVYGRSKTGKTTFAGSFPKPILLIDVRDHGTDSISDVVDVDVVEVEDMATFEEVYFHLLEGTHHYATVIIDTITGLQQMLMEEIGSGKKTDRQIGDWGTMTKRDWGDLSSEMKSWVSKFRNLDMEVCFLAQDRSKNIDDEDDSDNALIPEVGPAVMPSVATIMNAAVDIIANTFIRLSSRTKEVDGKKTKVEKTEYCLRIKPHPVYAAGIRKSKDIVLPDFIPNATHEDVIDIIKGN